MSDVPSTTRQLRSRVDESGEVRVSIEEIDTPTPRDHQVLVEIDAAPISPSDLALMLALSDVSRAEAKDGAVVAPVSKGVIAAMALRINQSLPVGNEGAGVVVAAGDTDDAQALLGKTVAFFADGSHAEHAIVSTQACLPLPDGVDATEGASAMVNPLTALGFVETMRRQDRTAMVHTAAASNLGQMLNRICLADGIGLVNVVRKPEQAQLLRDQGATHVVDSSQESFFTDLVAAIKDTGATLGFDAIGGGEMAGTILNAMEAAVTDPNARYSRYGTDVPKQVYIYGGLDRGPTTLRRGFGFAWSLGGWLLMPFLASLKPEDFGRLAKRISDELTTTFASSYTDEISLDRALDLDVMRSYAQQATGKKYLVRPQR